MGIQNKINKLKQHLEKLEHLNRAMTLIDWDMRTNMPSKAGESKGKILEYLSAEAFKMITDDSVYELVQTLSQNKDELTLVEIRMLEEVTRKYNETKKIPEDKYISYVGACSKAQFKWEEAKSTGIYEDFKPYLKEVVDYKKEFIEYWGYEDNKYNTLLGKYERGLTVAKLDVIFSELREGIIEILNKIKTSSKNIDTSFLIGDFDIEKQKELSLFVLEKLGFDMEAGRLDESVHPFTTNMGNKDVRLTTHYYKEEFTPALFGTIHEAGHGIYEQNIADDLSSTSLDKGTSMSIHESQSRFYENIVGRSLEFTKYLLPKLKESFPQLKEVTAEQLYQAINAVNPSFIRIEADELTYSLHIIIRYELEKALFNGEIDVDDLPRLWNEKYKEYLGVEPENDKVGVLQDVHWAAALFGYFPSYALGNLYGAQLYYKLLEENSEVMKEVEHGNFKNIHTWLKDNIHAYGSVYSPGELIRNITGEDLNSKYFISYLKSKYYKIYEV